MYVLVQELKKHTNFFMRGVKTLPNVDITNTKVEKLAECMYKVEVTVENRGFLPTYVLKEGLKNRKLKPITLHLEGVTFIQGKEKEEIGQLAGYGCTSGYNGPWGPSSREVEPLQKKVTYIISTDKKEINLTVKGSRIGQKQITIQLD